MTKAPHLLMKILVLLALAASGCNLPVRTPAAALTATAPSGTPAGAPGAAPEVTIIPKDPNTTPEPPAASPPAATGTPAGAPGSTPTYQPVERKDPNAILSGLRAALQQKDPRFFAQFAPEKLSYVDYIEGGQPVDRAKLLEDLAARFAASSPVCEQYGTYEQTLQVWTSGWDPLWQIDQICYQGCSPLNPPHTSQDAAFFFTPNSNGVYELNAVWLNDDNLWRTIYKVEMHACGEPYQAPPTPTVFSCPGAPAPRLSKGGFAYASTQTATPNRVRSAPGTSANIVGFIQPGQAVEIIDGPQCAQGYTWWKVRLLAGTLTGWTAEGLGSNYWLEPCASASQCAKP